MAIFNLNESAQPQSPEANTKSSGESGAFPLKTAFAIAVCAGALAVWPVLVSHEKGLAPEVFADTFRLHWPAKPAPMVARKPVAANPKLPAPPAFFVDDANSLDPFFAAVWKLEQGRDSGVVTILHYGDSPTTADLITGDIRAQLQHRFGDAGRGYTLIAKPWAWYGHRGVEMSDHGWNIRTGVGLMREGVYGLGGAAFEGRPGAWSRFRITESEQSAVDVEYLAKPGGGSFAVEADEQQVVEQSTQADTQASASIHVALPIGSKQVTIRPTEGTVTLFGADFRRGSSGLLYDSLGLNGATTSVLARVLKPDIWKQQMTQANPALVIVNYGSNESSFEKFVHNQYGSELRLAIQRIRQAAPNASILVMSPMDRGERRGLDNIATMSTIPQIVAIQRQVAAETHCAFFDTYDAMGGDGTMARWYSASPRLVTADLLHPTPQGATLVAGLFVEQLSLSYDRWKMQHGIALPAASPAAPAKAAALKPRSARSTRHSGKQAQ
jgi:lysophospholipase L1-like esterase